MDNYLGALLVVLVVMLVFGNPFTVATVIYLCKRTGKYLVPALAGVLVNVVSLALCALAFVWLTGDFSSDMLESYRPAWVALVLLASLLATLLHGLLLVGFVLLVIRERRLNQIAPSKLAIAVFVACLAVSALIVSPLTDDLGSKLDSLGDRFMLAYMSATQDESTEFLGHTVHVGDGYIYSAWRKWDLSEHLAIYKLGPGFGQLDKDFYLLYEPKLNDMDRFHTLWCVREGYSCEHEARENYRFISRTRAGSDEDDENTETIYYGPNCDAMLSHDGKELEGSYAEFVETFFSESCV